MAARKKSARRKTARKAAKRKAASRKTARKATKKASARRTGRPVGRPRKSPPPPPPAGQLEVVDWCPGCEEYRPISDWSLREGELQGLGKAFLCYECRAAKRTPAAQAKDLLPVADRRILQDLLTTRNLAATARKHGTTPDVLKARLTQDRPGADLLRQAWQEVLTSEGLDISSLTRVAKMQLHAMEPKWNPAEKRWDFFPDNKTRQRAVQWFARQHGVDFPAGVAGAPGATVVVNIETNLGGADEEPDMTAEFSYDVDYKIVDGEAK